MAQETLVVLINLVVDEGFLTSQLRRDSMLEAIDNLLQDGLVEYQLLAFHDGHHVTTRQQFATLQNDAVGTRIEHVHPQFLVEYLARKDEYLHLRIELLGLTADFHTYRCRATQSEVEQHEVGLLLFDESPEGSLVLSRADDFRFWYLVTYDAFCTFQFEGYVLNDN